MQILTSPILESVRIFSFKGRFSHTPATTRFGHSTPVIESERTILSFFFLHIQPLDQLCDLHNYIFFAGKLLVTNPPS